MFWIDSETVVNSRVRHMENLNVKIYSTVIQRKPGGEKKKNHKKEKEPKNYKKNVMKVLELPNFAMSLLEMFLQGHPCYQSEKKFVNVN